MLTLYANLIGTWTIITLFAYSISSPLSAKAVPNIVSDPYGLPTLTPEFKALDSKIQSSSSVANKSTSIPSLHHFSSHIQKKPDKAIKSDLNIPKNLIVPKACTQNCTKIIGTQKDDIIIATAVTDAMIYALAGNDVIQCGPGICKVFGGPGNNIMISGSSSSAQLFGGSGNNIFIGGTGDTLMVGGKGNDQFYAGSSHDVMIGGGGANYFDCGPNGNGVVLDFNAKNGDTKASNCKFVITVPTSARTPP